MNSSDLIHRSYHTLGPGRPNHLHSPKPGNPDLQTSTNKFFLYFLPEQRLLFVLLGITIASLFFIFVPPRDHDPRQFHLILADRPALPLEESKSTILPSARRVLYETIQHHSYGLGHVNVGGKLPLGLKRKTLRVLVTGGAGFLGSHLVDCLMERGDSVIVVDNFFTGRKNNLVHHFGDPRFELIRHDVVEPILLEVDQIYHLACPASPVHYKYNPVKTITTNVVGMLNMLGSAKRVG